MGGFLWDRCHNSIRRHENDGEVVWIHRKGAAAADSDFVVIPGSRGSLSYLVKPIGDGESHAWSLAHGAGRQWARSEARLRMRERFGALELMMHVCLRSRRIVVRVHVGVPFFRIVV